MSSDNGSTGAEPEAFDVKQYASRIGLQFAEAYYEKVANAPHEVHTMYGEGSCNLTYGTEGGSEASSEGREGVAQHVKALVPKQRCTANRTVSSQAAPNGIVVQVIGWQRDGQQPWRKFCQTFFLAEQKNGQSIFYAISNDIFQYLDSTDALNSPEAAAPKVVKETVTESVAVVAAVEEKAKAPAKEEKPAGEKQQKQEPKQKQQRQQRQQQQQQQQQVVVAKEVAAAVEEVTAPAPKKAAAPLTWAEKAAQAKATATTEASPAWNKDRPKTVAATATVAAAANSTSESQPRAGRGRNPSGGRGGAAAGRGRGRDEGNSEGGVKPLKPGCSLYVKNVPGNTTPQQLQQTFEKVGSVRSPGGVSVHRLKMMAGGRGNGEQAANMYAFVEFTEASSLKKCLSSEWQGKFFVNGAQLFVTERVNRSALHRKTGPPMGRAMGGRGGRGVAVGQRGRGAAGRGGARR